jgi:predicted ATPase/DNA-binding SARP family transcriptional activator
MPQFSASLLGPLRLLRDGAPVSGFESDKVRALLAYLLVEADRPHRRGALAELLWPERPERAALLNLNQALANLRRVVGDRDAAVPLLLATREAIQLNPAAGCDTDLARFGALLDACAAHQHRDPAGCAGCAERLEQAAALYRGAFLDQFAPRDSLGFEEWALVVRERAHRQVLAALDQLATYHERRGAADDALWAAYRQIELDPWREEAHRQVMRLLWRDGQRAAALAQYERCRATLEAELGLEPDEATAALYEQIRADQPGAAAQPPAAPPATLNAPADAPLTPFVGRAAELARLADYLGDPACRLVTIVGLGGSGKTRLAMQAAQAQRHAFADGACFVPLAPARAADEIAGAIAQRLGMTLGAAEDPLAQLGAQLRDRRLLLILDNLEHLPGAGAALAGLLERAPALTVLATSRERLGLRGEWVLDLAGLDLPADASPAALEASGATALFMQAARRARASFAPDADERRAIARICHALAGHPLAIELAAAWAHMLSCAEIEAELAGSQELLASAAPDLPERHRTIRAVFDSTWRLLTADERQAMRRLAVFRGGFGRAAAAEVAGASLPRLASALNRALVARAADGRYDMHEFVRQYADEQLAAAGEQAEIAGRHLACFRALVDRAEPHMKGPDEAAWHDQLEREHDNLRAAIDYALTCGQIDAAGRMCEVLRWFWYVRGHVGAGRVWTERVLRADEARGRQLEPRTRARLCHGGGIFADEQADYAQAAERYAEALALFRELGDTKAIQSTTNSLGMLASAQGQHARAQECFEESLRLSRELGHGWGIANSLNSLGTALYAQGDTQGARACYDEALPQARAVGYEQLITLILDNIGELALDAQEWGRAHAAFQDALAIQQTSSDPRGAALSLQGLGMVALGQGDLDAAAQHLHAGLRGSWQNANRRDLSVYVDNLAALYLAQGRPGEAARLCGATDTFRTKIGASLSLRERATFERTAAAARAQLGDAAFDIAWAGGAAATLDQLLADALGE